MKKPLYKIAHALVVLGLALLSLQHATAEPVKEAAPSLDNPVLVIRFQESDVRYEHALKTIVEKVQEVKPSAQYYVTAVVPANSGSNAQNAAVSQGKKVASSLEALGIGKDRIRTSSREAADVRIPEVQVSAQ